MSHRRRDHYGRNPHNGPMNRRVFEGEMAGIELKTKAIGEESADERAAAGNSSTDESALIGINNPSVETTMSLSEDRNEDVSEKEAARGVGDNQEKNLLSAVILLSGLFVGSMFVDLGQLVSREGFSPRAVKENTVLEAAGKTWVAYADPKVGVQVVTEESCAQCSPDEALVWLRRILPTMEATPVEAGTDQGKALIGKFGITTLPAFIFSKEIESTDFYGVAAEIFNEKDDRYLLDTARLGIKPGKYLALPEMKADSIVIGSRDAKVKVVEYSDFQCPYCKAFHVSVKQMLSEYGDQVAYVYKHLPLSFHPQAENAALASECANEQGKFAPYMDMLFDKQAIWGASKGTQLFKGYARQLGLRTADFNACLDTKKYADKIAADAAEAAKFGVDGTPGVFVGDEFFAGAVQYSELKTVIDGQMAK